MKLRKILIAAFASALTLSASADAQDLVVATDTAFVPFEFKEGDKYVGFDIDMWDEIAKEIGELNGILYKEGRRCILIGFGRVGTSDRWLGIPLSWSQMSQAHIIVEADRKDLRPEPSLGSHFFHNLTATNMGYFHIPYEHETDWIDWNWLQGLPVLHKTQHVTLVRRQEPFVVKIDGRSFKGAIYK